MQLPVLYEDNDLIVIDKPAGMLSVSGKGIEKLDSVEYRVKQYFPQSAAIHRLDMATSGILLIAKNKPAERFYKNAFANRLVKKSYQALCSGKLIKKSGQINLPLIVDYPNRPKQKVCFEFGKPSLTFYRVIEENLDYSKVYLIPYTGRSHQLRVHLQYLGNPILGDDLYNNNCHYSRLMLHSHKLKIYNPEGKLLIFNSPCPF